MSRMDNLTTPAWAIVAVVLNKTLPPDLALFDLAVNPAALWEEQPTRIEGHDASIMHGILPLTHRAASC